MFASVRGYFVHMSTPRELAERVGEDFADRLSERPGFVAYDFMDCGDGEAISISVFREAAQAHDSRELARRWTEQHLADMELTITDSLHGLEGLKHMASSIVPPIYDYDLPDEHLAVTTEDGWDMTDRILAEEGIYVGHSTGANVFAAVKLAEKLHQEQQGGCVVTIACDRGDRYLSTGVYGG